MIIAINEDWRFASDPLQWMLQKRKPVKGETLWRSVAYFGNLDTAIIELVKPRSSSHLLMSRAILASTGRDTLASL